MFNITNNEALNLLMDRLSNWTQDETTHELFGSMYESYLDGGVFECGEYSIMGIVDNDYVNYCTVIDADNEEFKDILALYEAGERDISCAGLNYSFVEAVNKDKTHILVRS